MGSPCNNNTNDTNEIITPLTPTSLPLPVPAVDRLAEETPDLELKREDQIREFILTEKNYVETLRVIMDVIYKPLKAETQSRQPILSAYKFSKIFINIDHVLDVSTEFLKELQSYINGTSNASFGDICARHMANFDCYRKYGLERREAQLFHGKEFKSNQAYRSFLVNAKGHPRCRMRQLSDLLAEPAQRLARYAMMLKNILECTLPSHRDYNGLTNAYAKASEVAMLADDDPTKLATMLMSLYHSIKDSPCSLINQSRSFVAHLDATEIHRVSNKPVRAVTLFLFNDKLMVANRPSYNVKGIDLCDIGIHDHDPLAPSGSVSKKRGKDQSLKFRGWVDLEQVEIFQGAADRPGSFLLRTSTAQQQDSDAFAVTSFEKHFQKGPRLYSVVPPKEYANLPSAAYERQAAEFIATCQKTQALSKQYSGKDQVYHREWDELPVYSNLYTPTTYRQAKYRNNVVIMYLEDSTDVNLEVLKSRGASPWIVCLVQANPRGFRLHIASKTSLMPIRDPVRAMSPMPDSEEQAPDQDGNKTIDFECVMWNNVILCERRLRASQTFSLTHDSITERELQRRSRSRSRSRSASSLKISKFFSGTMRSRSSSPSRNPTASLSSSTRAPDIDSIGDSFSSTRSTGLLSGSDSYSRSRANSMTSECSSTLTPTDASLDVPHASITQRRSISHLINRRHMSIDSALSQESDSMVHRYPSNGFPFNMPVTSASTDMMHRQDLKSYRRDSYSIDRTSMELYQSSLIGQVKRSFSGSTNSMSLDQHDQEDHKESTSYAKAQAIYAALASERERRKDASPVSSDGSSRPCSRSSTISSSTNSYGVGYGHSFNSRSGYTNTMSSLASHSTRSSISLEDIDFYKSQQAASARTHNFGSTAGASDLNEDDDIVRRVNELLASQRRLNHQQAPQSSIRSRRDSSSMVSDASRMPTTTIDDTKALDQVATAVETFGDHMGNRWQTMLDRYKVLGNKITQIAEQPKSNDLDSLNDLYNHTYNDMCDIFQSFNTEMEQLSQLLHSYRREGQLPRSHDLHYTETLLERKLTEAQLAREHWRKTTR
ncbi:uncharacterized protein BYT42DRAFT_569974 [Radiomyces spectabilis]|uniref:uncharacterized protein n=1 Tax=Radiomyces spectabilis TaxID=64574 RepID=UPI00221FADFE|nr:uncharacterized protein BYT42DRAFT_569974 [Radiomyces spectabilis]KAI8379769.1 hypothetical protein BYT42DRAFT_569974 [Radiomyces spectabilis]